MPHLGRMLGPDMSLRRIAPTAYDHWPADVIIAVRTEPLTVRDRFQRGVETLQVPRVVALRTFPIDGQHRAQR